MKKILFGTLALLVPMALVSYGNYVVDDIITDLLALSAIILVVMHTRRNFRPADRNRSYADRQSAALRVLVGNAVITMAFLVLFFAKANATIVGFNSDPTHFMPLVAGGIYIGFLGIVIAVAYLVNSERLNTWHIAQVWSAILFALSIILACTGRMLNAHGMSVPIGKFALALMIIAALSISATGYKSIYGVK